MARETNIRHRGFVSFDVDPIAGALTVTVDPITGRQANSGEVVTDPASPDAPVYNGPGDYTFAARGNQFDFPSIRAYGGAALIPSFAPISPTLARVLFFDITGAGADPPRFSFIIESYEPMS